MDENNQSKNNNSFNKKRKREEIKSQKEEQTTNENIDNNQENIIIEIGNKLYQLYKTQKIDVLITSCITLINEHSDFFFCDSDYANEEKDFRLLFINRMTEMLEKFEQANSNSSNYKEFKSCLDMLMDLAIKDSLGIKLEGCDAHATMNNNNDSENNDWKDFLYFVSCINNQK